MIEFNGELSDKCKKYILKREAEISLISASIVAFLFCIPSLVLTFLYRWIFIIAIPVLIMFVILSAVRPSKKYHSKIFPTRITIKDDDMTSCGEEFNYMGLVSQVKKVVDMGEWYHIFFRYPYKNPRFVCQKDLLKQGTIKEFEEIFKDKIVYKAK